MSKLKLVISNKGGGVGILTLSPLVIVVLAGCFAVLQKSERLQAEWHVSFQTVG